MATADGTGINPSVTPENAPRLVNFIINNHPLMKPWIGKVRVNPFTVVDVGCGLGHLVNEFNTRGLYKAVGYEGNRDLASKAVTDSVKHVVIGVDEIEEVYDLSTSFEVIEHIEQYQQVAFWAAIKKLAPYHFCSIHVKNQEDHFHQTIRSEDWWVNYIEKIGGKVTEFQRAVAYPSDYPFHKDTNIAWECSFICLIEWAN